MNDTDQAIILKKYEKKIIEAFEIFDHTGNKTIDIREIATVLCSLGCVPSKTEINEIIQNIQEPENRGSIHLSKFLPFVSNVIQKCRFHPASAEELLKAFQIFDEDSTGYLSSDLLTEIMTERGECFSKEELNEMMTVAGNSIPGSIFYELYINHLMDIGFSFQYLLYKTISDLLTPYIFDFSNIIQYFNRSIED